MGTELHIEAEGATEEQVAIAALFWAGAGWDAARWRTAAGDAWAARSRVDGGKRVLEQYRVVAGGLAPLDHTHFELGPDGFAEVARYREAGGPNLHPVAIRLPGVLRVGVALEPLPGATVTLVFAGALVLRLGEREERARGACLRASAGGHTRDQWLVEGVGEVALGAPGAWERWMVAWSGGGRALFGGVDPALIASPPPLPPPSGARSAGGIFG